MDWQISIKYKETRHTLQAEKIYESSQIMRIKVHGRKSAIVLQNDYPSLLAVSSKKKVKWKIIDTGDLEIQKVEDARLISNIMDELEYQLKGKGKIWEGQINHLRSKQ